MKKKRERKLYAAVHCWVRVNGCGCKRLFQLNEQSILCVRRIQFIFIFSLYILFFLFPSWAQYSYFYMLDLDKLKQNNEILFFIVHFFLWVKCIFHCGTIINKTKKKGEEFSVFVCVKIIRKSEALREIRQKLNENKVKIIDKITKVQNFYRSLSIYFSSGNFFFQSNKKERQRRHRQRRPRRRPRKQEKENEEKKFFLCLNFE